MQEVQIRLRFNRECLGAAKRKTNSDQIIYGFLRDSNRRVMFLPTWWGSLMHYAAKVVNCAHKLVGQINWDPVVDAPPNKTFRRYLNRGDRYALHEAFLSGTVIGVKAVLPDGLTIDEFQELLEVSGAYRGISHYQPKDDNYGTFEVESISPTIRRRTKQKTEQESAEEVGS